MSARQQEAVRVALAAVVSGEARRVYRASRRRDPDKAAVERWQNRTRNRALALLARKHPASYGALLQEVRVADPAPGEGAAP